MKALIAIVMFLFGLFVGVLIMPTFNEMTSQMYIEEEYSTPRVKTILNGFGITLPLEVSDLNLFMKQDGEKKQVWVKFECSPEVRDAFMEQLNQKHSGLFNREIETPKLSEGTPIIWWTYRNSYRYYEFKDMCAAYDDLLHNLYIYSISDGSVSHSSEHAD